MLIKVSAVKQLVKEHNKQVSKEFLEQLDYKVRKVVIKAVENAKHFKRLTGAELL
ncbi:MAG: hypothetical protein KKA19_04695 [Candidatus Margulisbacteria bacterium]|nr:hypothetical protein [Candidatus Margulisiibacteriota bacterium]